MKAPKEFPPVDEIFATWREVPMDDVPEVFGDEPIMGTEDQSHHFYARYETGRFGEYLTEAVYILDCKVHQYYDTEWERWNRYRAPLPGTQEVVRQIDELLNQANGLVAQAKELAKAFNLPLSIEDEITQWNVDDQGQAWVSSARCW